MLELLILVIWGLLHVTTVYAIAKFWRRFGEPMATAIVVGYAFIGAMLIYVDALVINFIWGVYTLKNLWE